ncbi:glycosyl hydrolase [Campylobacterota bacterium]
MFKWDPYSDQPYQIKDRAFKKAERKKEFGSLTYTFLISLILFPITLFILPLLKKKEIDTSTFFGMSVNLDKEPDLTPELINELGVKHLLIRFPMSDMENIENYIRFIKTLKDKTILLNVIQDPDTIKDTQLLKYHFQDIFEKFSPFVQKFQIGTTINRSKWGFFSVNQYLRFYQVAYRLKKESFKDIKLLGPSVIDFEFHFLVHALFNFFSVKFDAISALLYVDRRGAPENTQVGLDLISKIHLIYGFATISPKSTNEIIITETNWPLSATAPYAPTSEHECIDKELYANYMIRYYLLAMCSNMVKSVYWHQLIAPGYGLIDNRDNKILKGPAYNAFKTMLQYLQGAKVISFIQHKLFYEIIADLNGEKLQVLWCNDTEFELTFSTQVTIILRDGEITQSNFIRLSGSPVYIKENNV